MTNKDLIKKAQAIESWLFPLNESNEIRNIKYEILADKVYGLLYPLEKYGLQKNDIRFKALELGATMIANYHRLDYIAPAPGPFYMYEGIPIRPVDNS